MKREEFENHIIWGHTKDLLEEFDRLKLLEKVGHKNENGECDPILVQLWYLKKLEKGWEALGNVKNHLDITGGSMVKMSATYQLVCKALNNQSTK